MIDANSSGGGVTSWNDLEDRPFGYDGTYVVCMEEREIPADRHDVFGEDFLYQPDFERGSKYRITIDGVPYETTANGSTTAYGALLIGNPVVEDERNDGDTGEPFAVTIGDYPGGHCYSFYFADSTKNHIVKFEYFKGVLNTIDEIFIPDTIARTKDIPIVTEHFSGDWHDLTNKPFVDEIRKVIENNSGYEWDSESRDGHLFATIPITRYYDLIDGKEYTINIGNFSANGIYVASDSSIRAYVDDYYDYEVHFYFPPTDNTVVWVSTDAEFDRHVNDNDPFAIYEADWHTVINSECLPDDLSCSWNDLTDKPFGDTFNDMIFIEVEAWESYMVGPGEMGYRAIINPVVSDVDEFEYGKTYEVRLNDEYFGKWVCDGTPYFAERIKLTNAEGKSYEVMICTENTTSGRYIMLDGDAVEIANWPKAVFRIGVAGVKTLDPKYLPKAFGVAQPADDSTVTGAQFNSLLTALRNAGYLVK